MTRFQMMFLFFSILFLTVKVCFIVCQYFITQAIADRAIKKKELESKVVASMEAQRKKQLAEQKVVNLKNDLNTYSIRRNKSIG